MVKAKLTIIIPAYNEINTIQEIINKVSDLKILKQLIVVDDNSTDGTKEVILKNESKIDKIILHNKNKGKGAAIQSAQPNVSGEYVIIQDADLEYDPKDFYELLKKIEEDKKKKLCMVQEY
ncbi:glycosyltransferase family 2 protein [Candidatus Pelagibacter bacterium nBUS_44]|uniref:glycosyltransferase family 2 protein n=1 Tax=Candidatus Pelagibacter bacterium nBUS_44 TaxID=3374195 RepID=UPI003EBB1B1C